ncbi:pyridoxamine 5'-phosphate oxidase family protein [Streptomyces hirsutus]|uniref:pyridoxamine 5'-phosphate oxidase family protein n=1 Tax=Streptomyces hirsutus TaxID=35620 RepID=UPI003866732B
MDGEIAFRTAPESIPRGAVGSRVAFEVDHVDEAMSQDWSVLVAGHARVVTEPDAVRRPTDLAHTKPWPGGEREMWVSIEPTRITGHRITSVAWGCLPDSPARYVLCSTARCLIPMPVRPPVRPEWRIHR